MSEGRNRRQIALNVHVNAASAAKPVTSALSAEGHIVLKNASTYCPASNDQLERPNAALHRAPCAHNRCGAHGAPLQISRPLQALVRCRLKQTINIRRGAVEIEDLPSVLNETSQERTRQVLREAQGLPTIDAILRPQAVIQSV